MFTNFYPSTKYYYSAKATKVRSGCWNSAAIEVCVVAINALYFCFCALFIASDHWKNKFAECKYLAHRILFSCIGRPNRLRSKLGSHVVSRFCSLPKNRSSNIWCCNSAARVMRCQRRGRGFESPQHRHGIGRLEVRTLVCETKDTGANPVQSPKLGVAQQ